MAEQYKSKGNECYSSRDYAKAIDWYSKAINEASEVAAYYGNRAAAYLALNKWTDALEDSQTSVRLDPKFTKGYMRIGKCHTQRGEYVEAERALQKALSLEPSNTQVKGELEAVKKYSALVSAGEAALAAGEHDRAMVAFTTVLMQCPDAASAKRGCAACHVHKKNYTKASELLREVLQVDSSDEVAHMLRAEVLYYTGALDSAVKMFVNLLELDPDNTKMRALLKRAREITRQKDLGDTKFKAGQHAEAVEAYTAALNVDAALDSLNSKIYCNRAACYSALKQWEDALTDCNQAILMDEKYTRAYIRRAKCHAALSNHQDAVYDWNKAKELDPDNSEILSGLRAAQKELKKAERKDWYKILEISPDATDSDIKRAYRTQALKWHPDKHNETPESYAAAEARFKDITEANTVLSDPKARRRFDSGEDLEEEHGHHHHHGFTPDMFASFFGGGFGGGGSPFGGGGSPFGGGGYSFGGFDEEEMPRQGKRSGGRRR